MLKIATWNLNQSLPGNKAANRQLAEIEKIDADVWILTEAHPSFFPGPNYHLVAPSSPSAELPKGHRWVCLWVKGCTDEPVGNSDQDFAACALLTLPSNAKLVVYGTVLPWLGRDWKEHPAKDNVAFIAALQAQAADISKLKAQHTNAVVCYAGDFNQDLNDKHYYGSTKGKAALNEALSELGLKCHTSGANDPVAIATNAAHATIDHICTSKPTVNGRGCWPHTHEELKGLSDHFGSWVTIET